MENTFATFKPIELNPSPSKEEIANYYLENNMSTSDEFLDNFFNIPTASTKSSDIEPVKPSRDIKGLLSTPIPKVKKQSVVSSADVSEKGKYIMDYFENRGLTREQAAGIVGNLHAESSLNPEALGDNGTSFGLAQWHKERFDGLKKYAFENGKHIADLDLQLDYLWNELQTTENDALRKLVGAKTINDAAKVFAHEFERMKTYSSQRENFAMGYYNL